MKMIIAARFLGLLKQTFNQFLNQKHQIMSRNDNNPREQNENKPKERINLNDYYRKDDTDILKSSASPGQNVERSLDEQMGGSDDTVTSEPNHI